MTTKGRLYFGNSANGSANIPKVAKLKMQVWPGNVTVRAADADRLPFAHHLTLFNINIAQVCVESDVIIAVIYHNPEAVTDWTPTGYNNRAAIRRLNRGSLWYRDIQRPMAVVRILRNGANHGPDKRTIAVGPLPIAHDRHIIGHDANNMAIGAELGKDTGRREAALAAGAGR